MTAVQSVQQHPASVDAYIRHGWSLVPIPPGTKGPTGAAAVGWNRREKCLKDQTELMHGYGIGLAHAYSGTMAFDIDNWDATVAQGIDLDALYAAPDAVIINSGRPGHGKLLYRMPFGLALPSKKIIVNASTAYELRCATANGLTVQDVLPPSIHPDTRQPYHWAGLGHWTRLPVIPQVLLDIWQELLGQDKERTIATGEQVDASWEEIRQALEAIPADCAREEWVNVGMALHWAGTQTEQPEQALQLWNEWSAQSPAKYPGERGIVTQWASFRNDKATAVKLGTLFHIAKQHGWQRPTPDAAALFSKVDTPPMAPVDVMQGLRPPPPEMDMTLWPSILQTRANEIAESVGCDPLVPLFAGLSAVCGVVDARIRLELMPGFKVPPVLWLMTLGDPADKKSPGSRPMLTAIKDIEAEDRPRYQKELLDWEGKEAAYASAKKNFLAFSASPDALLGAQAPAVPEMPPQPVPLKITVSDITSQKLVRSAAERPRGLLCYLDEMNSWIRKLTDKTSGEDRSAWVVSYESEHYEMDRVGAGAIHCENLAVSIYGNIQPQVFKQNLASLAADGLLQRFIPAILRGNKTKLGNPVPEYMTSSRAWENTLRLVYALPPQTYRMSPQAYEAYREFQSWYEGAKRDERLLNASSEYMTAFGKLEGTAGRLILMMHLMESPFSPYVDVEVVHRVVHIVRGYIIPAFRYALGELAGVLDDSFDQWMTDYIIQVSSDTQTVDLRSLKRSARRQLEGKNEWQKDQMVLDAMHTLEKAGWVLQIDEKMNKHQVVWAINPSIAGMFREYREKVVKAKQRHADYIYRYATAQGKERKFVKGYDPETMD
ncbi:MAG: hypothetical protein AN484_11905 [Aphanizomenon flos-aquae WA102]|uniref:DNA primase/polymerase bifunctional N-terminal domain-containing protein n=1 Tax=Aphanizomenon flos-aquae WA102 TaxID=1710896 RepID=A0A1B7X2D1_APHFL|nr:MAG: hypothetical protein AN484_11905 [Aphanizomenon flos-aquae WA102]